MNKKGFTLIELLAVIIILGILMIIAIPSVTKYISDSRKSSYVDTAKEIIGSARNLVNSGSLEMYDTNATYYIESDCIKTENDASSPYGKFTKAYVVVTYDGNGYTYYWTSVDDAGQGIKDIIRFDKLDTDNIDSDLNNDDISTLRGIDGRSKTIVVSKANNCQKEGSNPVKIKINGETGEEFKPVCKRATSLHKVECYRNANGCIDDGVNMHDLITYGNENTTPGVLKSGDAFDCDVNNDGVYDSNTERFYYLTNVRTGVASLLYYSSVLGGSLSDSNSSYYDTNGVNNEGPISCYDELPSTSQWSNPGLISPGSRQIKTETGSTSTLAGTISSFEYTNKAARLLTYQEVQLSCNESVNYVGALDGCNFLFENTEYETYSSNSKPDGYWLETPSSSYSNVAWRLAAYIRDLYSGPAFPVNSRKESVRPVIEVNIIDIDY